jgi:pyridoxal phosphate enzyme (YggS family)
LKKEGVFMGIPSQVEKIRESLKDYPNVRVVAAVKCLDVMKTKEVVNAGIRELGENRKEEFMQKYEALKGQKITWHYFGILQVRPKLTSAFVDCLDYLHSLTSIDLANALNNARKRKDPLKCFVQVNIASAQNKAGLDVTRVVGFIKSLARYEHLQIVGLMTTAVYTYDEEKLANYFDQMVELQKEVQDLHLPYAPCTELSMGMTNDYLIAVKHGATMVRLGTILTR